MTEEMEIIMRRFFSGVALGAILLFCAFDANAAAIRLMPSDASVDVGSTFTMDVVAEDINLGAYTLLLDYPAALVSMAAVDPIVFDQYLGQGMGLSLTQGDDLFGQARLDELSFADEAILLSLQGTAPGNLYRLATLTFRADAAGTAVFGFDSALLSSLSGTALSADLVGATVEITNGGPAPIPEPGTWSAMAIGVAGLWVWRRHRSTV
jgi:hypothetical protein